MMLPQIRARSWMMTMTLVGTGVKSVRSLTLVSNSIIIVIIIIIIIIGANGCCISALFTIN